MAKQVVVFHYLGDAKPVTIEIPKVENKSGVQTLENSKINFSFEEQSTLGLNADFNITIDGNTISIEGNSINKSIINVQTARIDDKTFNAFVKFIPSEEIFSPVKFGITVPILKNNELTFITGKLSNKDSFNLNFKIIRKHLFKSDEEIINRKITEIDYTTEVITDGKTKVILDLNKLTNNKFDAARRNEVTISIALTYDFKNVVNLSQLGKTQIDRTEKFQVTPNQN
jgi:hypothetical protein